MNLPKLFPDEAELVERDAADLLAEGARLGGVTCAWEDCPEEHKAFFRAVAQNPYQLATRTRR